jgi:hypothetical protein
VYALLLVPEVSSPVDSMLAALYHTNKAEYAAKISSHVLEFASRPLQKIVELVLRGDPSL